MSPKINPNSEIIFEMNIKVQMKNYTFAFRANPKVIVGILLPIAIKIISILLNHYGATAP